MQTIRGAKTDGKKAYKKLTRLIEGTKLPKNPTEKDRENALKNANEALELENSLSIFRSKHPRQDYLTQKQLNDASRFVGKDTRSGDEQSKAVTGYTNIETKTFMYLTQNIWQMTKTKDGYDVPFTGNRFLRLTQKTGMELRELVEKVLATKQAQDLVLTMQIQKGIREFSKLTPEEQQRYKDFVHENMPNGDKKYADLTSLQFKNVDELLTVLGD